MNLHNLKQDYPKMPVEIKNMISSEVENHLSEKKSKKFKKYKSIAAAAAIILLAGTTGYAASKLIELHSNKTGNYSYETEIINSQDNSATETDITDESYITVNFLYLPDPLVVTGLTDKLELEDPANPQPYYSYFSFYELPESGETYYTEHTDIIYKEELTIGDMPAIFYEKNVIGNQTNKYLYEVVNEEFNLLIQMNFDDRIGKDDAIKILENMVFSKTNNKNLQIGIGDLSYEPEEETSFIHMDYPEQVLSATKEELHTFHSIGETFTITGTANYTARSVDACVKGVQVFDNINQLPDDITEAMKYWNGDSPAFLDEEGNVLPDTLYYIKGGDGINTISEVLKTEEKDTKLVYIEVEYTNTDETSSIYDLLFYCQLYTLNDMGDYYEPYEYSLPKEVEGCDWVKGDLCSPTISHILSYNGVKAEDNNHILSISPGETYTVYHLYLVHEDYLDDMYVDLQENPGGSCTMIKDNFNISFVDISQ